MVWLHHRILASLLAAVAFLATAPVASAQTFWFPGGDGNWFNSANWVNGGTNPFTPPDAAGAWAAFGQQTGNPARTITVDGTATVGRISFTSIYDYTLNAGGISLNSGNFNNALIDKDGGNAAGDATINTPLTIGGLSNGVNLVNDNTAGTLTIASLSGSGSSVTVNSFNGSGLNTALAAPNLVVIQSGNYGGAGSVTTIAGGTLRADEGVGLPTNTQLTIGGSGAGITSWEVTQDTTVTRSLGSGTGNIRVLGENTGFSVLSGTLTLNFGGSGSQVQWGSSDFNPSNSLVFGRGAAGASDDYVFQNGLDLNGATRTIRVVPRGVARLTGNIVNQAGTTAGLNVGSGGVSGVLELTGTNTYNGTTTVDSGTLRGNAGAGLSANSNIVLNGGILENSGAAVFDRALGTGAGQIRVAGATSGFSAFGGTHTIRLNGGTGTVQWGSANFNPTDTLAFNGLIPTLATATALVDFQNGLDLNSTGVRFISVANNAASSTDGARISGIISNSAGPGFLVVAGNGTLELTAANTYTGQTLVYDNFFSGATLKLSGSGSFANSPAVTVVTGQFLDVSAVTGGANYSATAGRFAVAVGQTLAGTGTVTGGVFVGTGATIRGGIPPDTLNIPNGQLTVSGPLRLAGGTLAVDLNGTTASGTTVSRVAVTGAGNTFDISTTDSPAIINLRNDGDLTAGQSYTFTIASAAGGFTRDGGSVSSFNFGSDFVLSTANWGGFQNVSLTASGSNLVLTFSPVPEPLGVGLFAVAGLGVVGAVRRWTSRAAGGGRPAPPSPCRVGRANT